MRSSRLSRWRRRSNANGPLPPLFGMVWDHCAPRRYEPEDVPDEDLQTILTLAAQAPSGFNLQPWRFVVVREQEQRDRLRQAAYDQTIIAEAPVVVVAYGLRHSVVATEGPGSLRDMAESGPGMDLSSRRQLEVAREFVQRQDIVVWLNRHVMVAFTFMMVAAQALGWDTSPLENFDARAVRGVLDLPDEAEVVAMLAIGRQANADPIVPGRKPLEELVWAERHGISWADPAGLPA